MVDAAEEMWWQSKSGRLVCCRHWRLPQQRLAWRRRVTYQDAAASVKVPFSVTLGTLFGVRDTGVEIAGKCHDPAHNRCSLSPFLSQYIVGVLRLKQASHLQCADS